MKTGLKAPAKAREWAAAAAGDEGADEWRDVRLTHCVTIAYDTVSGVEEGLVCRDFRAG